MHKCIHLFILSLSLKSLQYPSSLSRKKIPGVTGFFCSSLVTTIGHTSLSLYKAIALAHMKIITEADNGPEQTETLKTGAWENKNAADHV